MLSSGVAWGQFIRETDPGSDFAEAFLENFKKSLAFKLAQDHVKRVEQQRKKEFEALQHYRDVQNMLRQIQLNIQARQAEAAAQRAKAYEKSIAVREKALTPSLELWELEKQYYEKGELPPWKKEQMTPRDWAYIRYLEQRGKQIPRQIQTNLTRRAKIMEKVGRAYMSDDPEGKDRAWAMYQLNQAQTPEEVQRIYEQYVDMFPETVTYEDKDLSKADFMNLANFVLQSLQAGKPMVVKEPVRKTTTKKTVEEKDPLGILD